MSILCLINHEDVSSFPGMPESVFSLLQDIARDVIRYLHADAGLEGHSPDRLESYIARAESLSDAYDELALVVNEKEL